MENRQNRERDAADRLRRLLGESDAFLVRISVAESEARLRLLLGLLALAGALLGLAVVAALWLWSPEDALWVLVALSLVLVIAGVGGGAVAFFARTTLLALFEVKHQVNMRRTKGQLALGDFS